MNLSRPLTTLFVLIFARINFRATGLTCNFARIYFRVRPFYKKFFLYNLFETDEKRSLNLRNMVFENTNIS